MISVCVATFNGGDYIEEQLVSILKQLGDKDEVIISDDGSTDSTLSKIQQIGDERIRILRHNKLAGKQIHSYMYVTRNIEHALLNANGDFIYLCDQDDIWHPDKVHLTQNLLLKYSLVCSDCCIINDSMDILIPSYFSWNRSGKGIFKNIYRNSYLGCCMAFRRELLPRILPMSKFAVPHDIWIGLIAEWYGNVFFLENKLVFYRRHGKNLSQSGEKSKNNFFYKIRYRLTILSAFLKKILSL